MPNCRTFAPRSQFFVINVKLLGFIFTRSLLSAMHWENQMSFQEMAVLTPRGDGTPDSPHPPIYTYSHL